MLRVPPSFYQSHPIDAKVILNSIQEPSPLLKKLLEGGHSTVAGRLIGALRHIGKTFLADQISKTMTDAGYSVRETNPFTETRENPASFSYKNQPLSYRVRELWAMHRNTVIELCHPLKSPKPSMSDYLQNMEDIYTTDAYHSLSIEGYKVTPQLIERVKSRNWDSRPSNEYIRNKNALAARGYWQAFQTIKEDVIAIFDGQNAAKLAEKHHPLWYRELFKPCANAGIIEPSALSGYRTHAVYLRMSRYVPPRVESVTDAMSTLFDLLKAETHTGVKAILGHWLFGYIHPYPDGNGRIARFLMNIMLSEGGYPWTIIRVDDRKQYLSALESASVENTIAPFAHFIASRIHST